jgi:hypothetical protein
MLDGVANVGMLVSVAEAGTVVWATEGAVLACGEDVGDWLLEPGVDELLGHESWPGGGSTTWLESASHTSSRVFPGNTDNAVSTVSCCLQSTEPFA